MIGGGWTIASSASALAPTSVAATTATAAEDEGDDGGQPRGHDRRIEGPGYPPDLMTWRRRANGGLAALLTIALIAGCDATVPSATPSGSSAVAASSSPGLDQRSAPSGSPAAAEIEVPPARWSDCGKGFLCADIRVPRDYNDPSAGYLTVALVRLTATEPKDRIGSLLVNPGGPGGVGRRVRSGGRRIGHLPGGPAQAFRHRRLRSARRERRAVRSAASTISIRRPGSIPRRTIPRSSRSWSTRLATMPPNARSATRPRCPTCRPTPWPRTST